MIKQFMGDMKYVYEKLQDETSKKIFMERLSINLGNTFSISTLKDILYLKYENCIENTIDKLDKELEEIKAKETIIIWGAASNGKAVFDYIRGRNMTNPIIFCDKNDAITEFCGEQVIMPNKMLKDYQDEKIIIANMSVNEIKKELYENGIKKECIVEGYAADINNQYFDEIIQFNEDEVFIDGGGIMAIQQYCLLIRLCIHIRKFIALNQNYTT